jgi:hypothetical protein
MNKRAAASMGVFGLLLSFGLGCSSSSPPQESSCFTGLTATTGGRSVALTSCAGVVGLNPLPSLTVRQGDVITLKGLDARTFTAPASTAPSVVVAANSSDSKAKLTAVAVGSATITLQTANCLVSHSQNKCPALSVTVTSK